MPKILEEKILENNKLADNIFRMKILSPYISGQSKSGQFINIRCCDDDTLSLRRPISICDVNKDEGTFDIVYQVKGKGTKLLSKKKPGDLLNFIGPLGNFFNVSNFSKVAVVGGGIGVFPLLYLVKSLKDKCNTRISILGFRNKDYVVLEDEFKVNSEELIISTDDGSYGVKGLTTDLLSSEIQNGLDMIYACGPLPMLKKIASIAEENNIPCEISLEERMGCGVGACFVCACKIKCRTAEDGWEYKQVCKDGPVFKGKEVIFDD